PVPGSGEPTVTSSDYPDLSKVPFCYHDLKEVFSKVKATSLPHHREWDCAIDLLPGAPIPKARLYSISGPERKGMEEYIGSSLWSGIITSQGGFFLCRGKASRQVEMGLLQLGTTSATSSLVTHLAGLHLGSASVK
ncbi:hypothetical protein L3Q82_010387, partial [Scortum barcoo]